MSVLLDQLYSFKYSVFSGGGGGGLLEIKEHYFL